MAAPVECAGTIFSFGLEQLRTRNVALLKHRLDMVRRFCSGDEFKNFCTYHGIKEPTFEWSENNTPNNHNSVGQKEDCPLQRFLDACNSQSCDDLCAAIVFHGTEAKNVKNIMENGLDPALRRGQAYGPGEYFGKNPGISSSYCKAGMRMCVFLVIVPRRSADDSSSSTARPYSSSHHLPVDMIVVEDNTHQLPIGVLKLKGVDQATMASSLKQKHILHQLNEEAIKKQRDAKEAFMKAKIIQQIIKRELEYAADLYNRNKRELSLASRKEIAIYAYEGYDEEFSSFYFEGAYPSQTRVAPTRSSKRQKRVQWRN